MEDFTMFRHRVTSLVILVILSLFVQNAGAHLPLGQDSVTPNASVIMQTTEDPCVVRIVCSASCSFNTGTHTSNENHAHSVYALLQAYYYQPGGSPNVGLGVYENSPHSKTLWGQKTWNTPTLSVSKTIASGCWTGGAVSSGALGYTVGETHYQITDAGSALRTVCSPCNEAAAAPAGQLNSEIEEIDLDDVVDSLRNAIESARPTNPNVNASIYFEGRIQTLAFDPDNVYVYDSDDSTTFTLS